MYKQDPGGGPVSKQKQAPPTLINAATQGGTNSSGQYTGNSASQGSQPPPPSNPGRISGVGSQAKKAGGGGGGAPAKKKGGGIPGVSKYIAGDSEYQQNLSDLLKSFQTYKTSNAQSKNDIRTAFATTMQRMGDEKAKALQALQDDFASRGLLSSGLYGQAVGDYTDQYGNTINDATTSETQQLRDLQQAMENQKNTYTTNRQDLRQQAVRKRAEQYGIKS